MAEYDYAFKSESKNLSPWFFLSLILSSIPNRAGYADCSKLYPQRNDYEHN